MFGRGVRLTALGGLASAALVHNISNVGRGEGDFNIYNSSSNTHAGVQFQSNRGPESFSKGEPRISEGMNTPGGVGVSHTSTAGGAGISHTSTAGGVGVSHTSTAGSAGISNTSTAYFPLLDIDAVKPNDQGRLQAQQEKLKTAINKARDLCWCKMYESGSPGMVVAISVNGKIVWQHGFGYADLENKLLAGTACIMRIASISKCLTMAVLAKLWEEGKVDLDAPVSRYVPSWPDKLVEGVPVQITVRQLCSHLGGIRHYTKKGEKEEGETDANSSEFKLQEYHIRDHFNTTEKSLELFKNDSLFSVPGTEFLYTTHGFTLLAAVIETVTGEPFAKYMTKQFKELGLNNTVLDENGPLVYNRSKYYVRDSHHRLRNAPYVDNSYKWAGGGFLSNVQDLVKFGNAMLFSFQQKPASPAPKTADKTTQAVSAAASKVEAASKAEGGSVAEPASVDEAASKAKAASCSEHLAVVETVNSAVESASPQLTSSDRCSSGVEDGLEEMGSGELLQDVGSEELLEVVGNEGMLEEVVFQPGPFNTVNNVAQTKVKLLPGYLKPETVKEMWTGVPNTTIGWGGEEMQYGLGWGVRPREKNFAFCKNQSFFASHTGGAIGASSVLLIAPHNVTEEARLPQGVVVAILCNLQAVGLNKLAVDIAKAFEGIETERPVKVQKVYQC